MPTKQITKNLERGRSTNLNPERPSSAHLSNMKTPIHKETAPASKLSAASIPTRKPSQMNRKRKRTMWQAVTAPFRRKCHEREYELQMKRNALAGAVLIPSQNVFGKRMGGLS